MIGWYTLNKKRKRNEKHFRNKRKYLPFSNKQMRSSIIMNCLFFSLFEFYSLLFDMKKISNKKKPKLYLFNSSYSKQIT